MRQRERFEKVVGLSIEEVERLTGRKVYVQGEEPALNKFMDGKCLCVYIPPDAPAVRMTYADRWSANTVLTVPFPGISLPSSSCYDMTSGLRLWMRVVDGQGRTVAGLDVFGNIHTCDFCHEGSGSFPLLKVVEALTGEGALENAARASISRVGRGTFLITKAVTLDEETLTAIEQSITGTITKLFHDKVVALQQLFDSSVKALKAFADEEANKTIEQTLAVTCEIIKQGWQPSDDGAISIAVTIRKAIMNGECYDLPPERQHTITVTTTDFQCFQFSPQHPHTAGNSVCWGEAKSLTPIEKAVRLKELLETVNLDSAYTCEVERDIREYVQSGLLDATYTFDVRG